MLCRAIFSVINTNTKTGDLIINWKWLNKLFKIKYNSINKN